MSRIRLNTNPTAPSITERVSLLFSIAKHNVTSDTLSASVTFEHTRFLHTRSNQLVRYRHHEHGIDARERVTTRTVRVVPMDGARPRTTTSLPTELLMKILEGTDSCAWQRDLLSFAQECRQWSQCSMKLLFARLESSEWNNNCPSFPTPSLDPCALGKALRETPILGLGMRHLDVDQHNGSNSDCMMHTREKKTPPGFIQALIAILRATKNLQRLHLSLGYSSHADALFSSLPKLDDLHTLSITQTTCRFTPIWEKYWVYRISTIQLSRCMARWPALTSLAVEHLVAIMGRLFLRRTLRLPRLDFSKRDLVDDPWHWRPRVSTPVEGAARVGRCGGQDAVFAGVGC